MKHYLIFAGTTEGRILTEHFLNQEDVTLTACTATEYGKILLPVHPALTVLSQRLDEQEMCSLMEQGSFDAVYDATHPYAVIVSENIKAAASRSNTPYHRILRPAEEYETDANVVSVSSMAEAVAYLSNTDGNILCTTGSKEIAALCDLPDYKNRVYARILPNPEMVEKCFSLGFQGKHLICMQGPFSEELNTALIHQFQIAYLITKNSGKLGGVLVKIQSAAQTGITLVLIGRPVQEEGERLEDIIKN